MNDERRRGLIERRWTIYVCPECHRATMDWKHGIECECDVDSWDEIDVVPASALRQASEPEARSDADDLAEWAMKGRLIHEPAQPTSEGTRVDLLREVADSGYLREHHHDHGCLASDLYDDVPASRRRCTCGYDLRQRILAVLEPATQENSTGEGE